MQFHITKQVLRDLSGVQAGQVLHTMKAVLQAVQELHKVKAALQTVQVPHKVKAVLQEAKPYLEKVRELDPDHEQVNWVYALYQLYYNLGDKAKADELEKMLNQ